jgi:hypothetical protein
MSTYCRAPDTSARQREAQVRSSGKQLSSAGIAACALILVMAAGAAAAEPRSHRLGEMELVYDAARWRAEPANGRSVTLQPIGEAAGKLDPVMVDRGPAGDGGCEHLARGKLAAGPYAEPAIATMEIAGRPAIRITAHTRCRNAMPRGVVICVEHRGSAYLLSATVPGCRSGARNLFSGIDPLMELAGGVRFPP